MSKLLRISAVSILMVFTFYLLSPLAFAVNIQDGLKAEILSDKESYKANEVINVTIRLHNTNDFPLNNIKIYGIIPDGLTLKSGQIENETVRLNANQMTEVSFSMTASERADGQTDNLTEETNPPLAIDPDNLPQDIPMPYTGGIQISMILLFVGLFLVGVGFLLIFKFNMGKKIVSIVLFVIFAVSITTGILSLDAHATGSQMNMELKRSILVNGKDYSLSANIEYSMSENTVSTGLSDNGKSSNGNNQENNIDYDWLDNESVKDKRILDEIGEIQDSFNKTGIGTIDKASIIEIHDKIIDYLNEKVSEGGIKDFYEYKECITIEFNSGITATFTLDYSGQTKSSRILDDSSKQSLDDIEPLNISKSEGKKKVATLQPYARYDSKKSIYSAVANTLTTNNNYAFDTNLESVSVEEMKSLWEYDIVLLSSHGMYDEKKHSYFGTSTVVDKFGTPDYRSSTDIYLDDLLGGRLTFIQLNLEKSSGQKSGGSTWYYAVTSEFFDYYYKQHNFNDSIIYIGSCHGADDTELADTLISNGAKAVMTYKNVLRADYDHAMIQTIFDEFLQNGENISQAVGTAKIKHGSPDPFFSNWYNEIIGDYLEEKERGELILTIADISTPEPSGQIKGTVTALDTGEPLEGAVLSAYRTNGAIAGAELLKTFYTDSNGNFSEWLPEGTYVLHVRYYNYDPNNLKIYRDIELENIEIRENETTTVSAKLSRIDLGFSGSIVDSETGKPISGVLVELFQPNSTDVITYDSSDFTGSYMLLLNDKEGTYTIRFTRSGYAPFEMKDVETAESGIKYLPLEEMTLSSTEEIPDGYTGIYTAQDLDNVRNNLNGKYILMNDIDLDSWGEWSPIDIFTGVFDGRGHIIRNLQITKSLRAGLFSEIRNATIQNVQLDDTSISSPPDTDIFAAGGITAYMYWSEITSCSNVGAISSSDSHSVAHVGGIVGYGNSESIIRNCFFSGNLSFGNSLTSSGFSSGGGIAGMLSGAISKCYSSGEITNTSGGVHLDYMGGIAGTVGAVSNCVTLQDAFWGELTRYKEYYLIGFTTSKESNLAYNGIGGIPVIDDSSHRISIAEAKSQSTYESLGWDFENIWEMVDGYDYPQLRVFKG